MEIDKNGCISLTADENLVILDILEAERKQSGEISTAYTGVLRARRSELSEMPNDQVVFKLGEAASGGLLALLIDASEGKPVLTGIKKQNAEAMLTAVEELTSVKSKNT